MCVEDDDYGVNANQHSSQNKDDFAPWHHWVEERGIKPNKGRASLERCLESTQQAHPNSIPKAIQTKIEGGRERRFFGATM
jgi:hypothetical protein